MVKLARALDIPTRRLIHLDGEVPDLRALRLQAGLTVPELAASVNVAVPTYYALGARALDLLGQVRIGRRTHRGNGGGYQGDDIAILRPEEVRQLPERQALVIAENGKPIIAKLHHCVAGKPGARLLANQRRLRERLTNDRRMVITPEARATAALVEACRLGFVDDQTELDQE